MTMPHSTSMQTRVEKDDCGLLCRYDRPTTATIDLRIKQDDSDVNDDMLAKNMKCSTGSQPAELRETRIGFESMWEPAHV